MSIAENTFAEELAQMQIAKGDNVSLNYFSELMQDYAQEQVLSNHSAIQAIALKNGASAVFAIGEDQNLYLILQKQLGADSWEQHSLTGENTLGNVTSYGASLIAGDGKNRIALGAVDSNGNPILYISEPVDLNDLDFESFDTSKFFSQIDLQSQGGDPLKGGKLNHVSVTNETGVVAWLPGEGDPSDAQFFSLGSNNQATSLTLPRNTSSEGILQIAAGQQSQAEPGMFALYVPAGQQDPVLQFVPSEHGSVIDYKLPDGDIPTCFALAADKLNNSQLYAGGSGLYYYKGLSPTILAKKQDGQSTTRMFAASESDGATTLWVQMKQGKNSGQGLFMLTNQSYQYDSATGTGSISVGPWNEPLQLLADISDFSPVKGQSFTNQLFYISNSESIGGSKKIDPHLRHFWQADRSTVWSDVPVPVRGTKSNRSFMTYTNTIKFTTDNPNKTFAGVPVKVTPSSSTYAMINNTAYALSADSTTEIILDTTGTLTIAAEINSLSGADLQLNADFLDAPFEMSLTQKVTERLANFTTGESLSGVVCKSGPNSGQPLFSEPGQFTPDTYDAIAASIQNFLQIRDYVSGSSTPPAEFGVQLSPGSASIVTRDALAEFHRRNNGEGVVSTVSHAIGDVLHSIEHFFEDAVVLVVAVAKDVENAVELTLTYAGQLFKFVINTVEQVFDAIEWFFKTLSLVLEDIAAIIGFLFEWGDVKQTKDAIKQLVENGFDEIDDSISSIYEDLNNWVQLLVAKIEGDPDFLTASLAAQDSSTLFDSKLSQLNGLTNTDITLDPKQNWVATKVPALFGSQFAGDGSVALAADSVPPIIQELMPLLEGLVKDLARSAKSVAVALRDFFQGETTFGQLLETLAKDLAVSLLDLLQILADAILDIIQQGMSLLKNLLEKEIDVPLFSTLYEDFISGDPLTPLDLFSLILAIPTTITYKLATGVAPIGTGDNQVTIDQFANVPAGIFNLGSSNSDVRPATDTLPDTMDMIYDILIAMSRYARCVTYPLVTVGAVIPIEAEGAAEADEFTDPLGSFFGSSDIGELVSDLEKLVGKGIDKILPGELLGKTAVWSVFADRLFRELGSIVSCIQSPSTKTGLSSITFAGSLVLTVPVAALSFNDAALNKGYLMGLGVLDALATTGFGCWNAYDTSKVMSTGSQASLGAQISQEIFQVSALGPVIANPIVALEEDTDPVADLAAVTVFVVREGAMVSSAVSETFVAFGD